MASVRPAAVAGAFYPGERQALVAELGELYGGVEAFEPRLGWPKALIVPHAGYIYSGPVAARAFDELAPGRGLIRRVVLLGPVHRVAVRGLALPGAEFFDTPLGRIPVDAAAVAKLASLPQVVTSAPAHAMEHALEVQLPFLQEVLGEFSLVPLAVGMASVPEVAEVLERLWGGPETLIVVSTDMSHYHAYEEAQRIDGATLTKIAGFATTINHDEACGATPLNGLLSLSNKKKLGIQLLAACNSGDTAGGKGRVVGYSSFALHEPGGAVSLEEAGQVLVSAARAAIENRISGKENPILSDPWLKQTGATFVTLMKDGKLRGCIGSLEAKRPLGVDVAENAVAAAMRDPRFPALTAAEWPGCGVEVSLLSTPKPMRFADEADLLEQVKPGVDGIIVQYEGKRATYLPQVWEGIADKQVFFRELMKKAGMPDGSRLARCKVWRYRVAKWKS
jgi:AmmeMemoRadiSam system protein B/AmmeMemoRadiSam system protein A